MKFIQSVKDDWKENILPSFSTRSTKSGSYSLALTCIVLAILIVSNVLFSSLPETWTQLDISAAQLYSLTANTKVVINNLEDDVTIYWVVQSGEEDQILEKLLAKYDSSSSHITVEIKNPDIYPTFAQQYTSGTVTNNDLIVECGSRYRYLAYDDFYEYTNTSYYSYASAFDGEGLITSAINYVVNEDLPVMYTLQGHGEAELAASVLSAIQKENIDISELSLLNIDEIPEDCDALLINNPQSDISDEEADMLIDYIAEGGKVIVIAGSLDDIEMTNLNSLLDKYNIEVSKGIVVEADRNYYAFSAPYVLLPTIQEHDITAELQSGTYYALMPIANGLIQNEYDGAVEITSLLKTSSTAISKAAGYDFSTYDFEDGDTEGQFDLAVAIENTNSGKLVWFSSGYLLDETYNSYSSGTNIDLFLNSFYWMAGKSESISIRSKSLDYEYLTISDSQASAIKIFMIVFIPCIYLAAGVVVVSKRRKRA